MRHLFFGGDILTMESPTPAEAMLIEGERILAVGDVGYLRRMAGERVTVWDLRGGVLLPGFVSVGGDVTAHVAAHLSAPHRPRAMAHAVAAAAAACARQGITCLHQRLRAAQLPLWRRICRVGLPLPLSLCADIEVYEAAKRLHAGVQGGVRLYGMGIALETADGTPCLGDRALGYALRMAAAEGVSPVLYADGAAAIARALRVTGAMCRAMPRLYGARTVLVGGRELLPAQAAQLRAAGIQLCSAVGELAACGDALLHHEGVERAARSYPLHSVVCAGVPLGLCGGVGTPSALLTAAVTRTTAAGVPLGRGERLSVQDALRALTVFGAWQVHGEWERGCLRAGMRADLVWLDALPQPARPAPRLLGTFVAGVPVWHETSHDFSTQTQRVPIVY